MQRCIQPRPTATRLTVAVMTTFLLAMPVHAWADPGTETTDDIQFGIDYTPPSERDEQSPEAQEHIAEALLTYQTVAGLTASDQAAIEAELAELEKDNPEAVVEAREDAAAKRMSRAAAAVPPTARTFVMTHQKQANGYYCGPATASMIAKYKGKSYSQATLAGSTYLKTDANGATKWALKVMAPTLNKIVGTTEYQQIQSPTLASLKASFVNNIGANYLPVAVDTYEYANSAHYNGHPKTKNIGHWIVGHGYSGSGSTLAFHDPAQGVWSGVTVPETFTYSASGFHQWVTTNGIVA